MKKTLATVPQGTLTVMPRQVAEKSIDWMGFARLETYHSVARSCGAYAVFYGAMAGQELLRMKSRYGSRKFLPALQENAPWMAESTAYLYIGYAKRLEARLKAIAPTVGAIDLAALPDPRDFDAAQKSDLFKQIQKSSKIKDAGQMWIALGLSKSPKATGGDTKPKCKACGKRVPKHEVTCHHCGEATGQEEERDLTNPVEVAKDIWTPIMHSIKTEGIDEKSWAELPPAVIKELKGLLVDFTKLLPK